MDKAKRAAVIAGNWKMNKTRAETKALVEELIPLVKDADCGVVVCVPYTDLETAVSSAAGTNITAARYSGIHTDRIKVAVFTMNGLLAAVGGIMLLSRTGSVKYNIAAGYEMQAIAVAVLSGASTSGGKGSVIGVLLSLILLTCLKNGLMIAFNDSFILNLAIGVLLIGMVLFPNIYQAFRQRRQIRQQQLLSLHS